MRKSGLPQGAWVLIADGEKALYLENIGDDMDMQLSVRSKDTHENPKAEEWATDSPGRFNDGPSVQRSSVETTDWHILEKERFASDIAHDLYDAVHRGAFRHLVVVASRPVLSNLRKEFHKEVADRIMLDVPKVLTNHTIDDIETQISKEISAK